MNNLKIVNKSSNEGILSIIVKKKETALDLVEAKNKVNTNRHPWEYARFGVLAYFLRKKIGQTDRPTIIDIGCGDSFVAESILKLYPKAQIIAVDTAFTDEIVAELQAKSPQQNLSFFFHISEIPPDVKADVILLMDVIEHIEDDVSFLKEVLASGFVTDRTNFFITVPAFQRLFCSHDVFLGHYRRYDATLLNENTRKAGLAGQETGYFFFSLLLPRYLQVRKEAKKTDHTLSTGIVDWNKGKLITGMVKTVLLTDFYLSLLFRKVGIRLKGLSVYTLCQKSRS